MLYFKNRFIVNMFLFQKKGRQSDDDDDDDDDDDIDLGLSDDDDDDEDDDDSADDDDDDDYFGSFLDDLLGGKCFIFYKKLTEFPLPLSFVYMRRSIRFQYF